MGYRRDSAPGNSASREGGKGGEGEAEMGTHFPQNIWIFLNNIFVSKWFEPRSISSLFSVIVRVSVVLKRTVGDSDHDVSRT